MKREGKIKSIFAHICIVLIIGGLIYGSIIDVSFNKVGAVAYAADNWQDLDDGDLVSAFQAYCKSRNLLVEGSAAYAATTWTSSTFNSICKSLGINVTELQAELKKRTDGNLGTRWLFSVTGINGFNRIAAELLQNNDLAVGDEDVDKVVYSGKSFEGYLLWQLSKRQTPVTGNNWSTYVLKEGTFYKYTTSNLLGYADGASVPFDSFNYSVVKNYSSGYTVGGTSAITGYYLNASGVTNPQYDCMFSGSYYSSGTAYVTGYPVVVYVSSTPNQIYLYLYNESTKTSNGRGRRLLLLATKTFGDNDELPDDTNVRIVTPTDKPILPEVPDDAPIEIGDDGDTGSGGGDDNPSEPDPDDWDPTTPTIPDPSSPDFPSVEIPEIDIPDLPSLNFSLGDLSEKFPFSIPFDAIALLTVLDGEPKAPHIQATIPIGSYYTWEFDADFSEFDNYARIFRAFEFIGFCIGMIWLTIHFIKG